MVSKFQYASVLPAERDKLREMFGHAEESNAFSQLYASGHIMDMRTPTGSRVELTMKGHGARTAARNPDLTNPGMEDWHF